MKTKRTIPVFVNRLELAKRAAVPRYRIDRALQTGLVIPDAIDFKGAELFAVTRIAEIAAAVRKHEAEVTA